jgi:hypothetical protein
MVGVGIPIGESTLTQSQSFMSQSVIRSYSVSLSPSGSHLPPQPPLPLILCILSQGIRLYLGHQTL